jgi:small subunit ribosomal protein S15
MHARTHGKAKSHRPVGRPKPEGSPSEKEIIKHITELAKEGHTPSQIGNILRDEHQILDVKAVTGKKLTELFNENATPLELPEDLRELVKKAVMLRKHLKDNKQDEGAKRGLKLNESKVQRLAKHHKDTHKLDAGWKYDWKQYTYLAE